MRRKAKRAAAAVAPCLELGLELLLLLFELLGGLGLELLELGRDLGVEAGAGLDRHPAGGRRPHRRGEGVGHGREGDDEEGGDEGAHLRAGVKRRKRGTVEREKKLRWQGGGGT